MPEKQIFVKIALLGYGSYISPLDKLADFIEEVKVAAEERSLDYEWILEFVEMTQEEYDAMPEFTGY